MKEQNIWLVAALTCLIAEVPVLAQGNVRWSKQFGMAGYDDGEGVATDAAGNVYLAGSTFGSLGETSMHYAIIRKYDSEGGLKWFDQFGMSDDRDSWSRAITLHELGGAQFIFVAGQTALTEPGHDGDAWIAKYDGNGIQVWTRRFGSSFNEDVMDIACDIDGNIYVTGETDGALVAGEARGSVDAWLAKYDMDGNPLWIKQLGTSGEDRAFGVATGNGKVYVAGETEMDLIVGESNGGYDAWLADFDSDGQQVAIKQFGSPNHDGAYGLTVDAGGSIFVAGYTNGTMGSGGSNDESYDAFVTKFLSNGTEAWTVQLAESDWAYDVAPDGAGGVFCTGVMGPVERSESPPTPFDNRGDQWSRTDFDAFVIRYGGEGTQGELVPISSAAADVSFDVAANETEFLYITGCTFGDLFTQNAEAGDAFLVSLLPSRPRKGDAESRSR